MPASAEAEHAVPRTSTGRTPTFGRRPSGPGIGVRGTRPGILSQAGSRPPDNRPLIIDLDASLDVLDEDSGELTTARLPAAVVTDNGAA